MSGKKNYLSAVIVVASIVLVICTLVYYLFFTTSGSSFLIKSVITRYVKFKNTAHKLDIKTIEGSLFQKLTLQDIIIEDLTGLPQDSVIKIQKLDIYFTSLNFRGLNADVFNGRLVLADSNPIIFYGRYHDNSFDFNIYSKFINVKNFVDIFMDNRILKDLSGIIGELDIYVKGSFLEPEMSGEFQIDKLSYKNFSVVDCPGSFSINLKDIKDELKLFGKVIFKSGRLFGPKAAVELGESRILFSGLPKQSQLDFIGTSTIEGVKINLALKGTLNKPNLKLTSEPAMPEGRLMVMLATGKRWKGAEASLNNTVVSPDLAADFIDYFVFGGLGSEIARQFGISDILLKIDKQTTGIGIKKEVSEKAEISYGIEQAQVKEEEPIVTQKIGGEYKITEGISVGVERELRQDKTIQAQEESEINDRVTIKYKKEF